MIKNNVLGDRLNAYRNGDPLPEIEKEIENYSQINTEIPEQQTKISILREIGYQLFNLSFVVLKSLAFGHAVNVIANYDWDFLAIISVGFSIQMITTQIFQLFNKHKTNEKS